MWRTSLLICVAVCGVGFISASSRARAGNAPASKVSPQIRPAQTAPATQPTWDAALTPKLAMKYGHLAMFITQCVPLDKYFYSDDPAGRTFIETCSKRAEAGLRLAHAARERFGPDGAKQLILDPGSADEGARELIKSGDPAFQMIDRMKEVIDNGKATLQMDEGADHMVFHLHFTPDGWKINFPELSGGIEHGWSKEYKEPDVTLATITAQGEIDQELAKEVTAGRFESVDALKAQRDQRNSQMLKKIAEKFKLPPKDADGAPATQPESGK